MAAPQKVLLTHLSKGLVRMDESVLKKSTLAFWKDLKKLAQGQAEDVVELTTRSTPTVEGQKVKSLVAKIGEDIVNVLTVRKGKQNQLTFFGRLKETLRFFYHKHFGQFRELHRERYLKMHEAMVRNSNIRQAVVHVTDEQKAKLNPYIEKIATYGKLKTRNEKDALKALRKKFKIDNSTFQNLIDGKKAEIKADKAIARMKERQLVEDLSRLVSTSGLSQQEVGLLGRYLGENNLSKESVNEVRAYVATMGKKSGKDQSWIDSVSTAVMGALS